MTMRAMRPCIERDPVITAISKQTKQELCCHRRVQFVHSEMAGIGLVESDVG